MRLHRRDGGFSLVELVAMLAIMAVLGTMTMGFLRNMFDQYRTTEGLAKLSTSARVVAEQFTRYVRQAVPNSVRISSTGHCLEFLPTVKAVPYLGQVPTSSNGLSAANQIAVSIANPPSPVPPHAVIAPGSSSEIYQTSQPAARANVSAVSASAVTLSAAHQFLNNSVSSRLYLAEAPKIYCMVSQELRLYEGYTFFSSALVGPPSGGSNSLVASGTSASGGSAIFSLATDTNSGYDVVSLSMVLTERDWSLPLKQAVVIRNAP